MELSTEKIAELKEIVQSELENLNLASYIDDVITACNGEKDQEDKVLDELRKKGFIEEIMDQLQCRVSSVEPDVGGKSSPAAVVKKQCPVSSKECLYFQILRGKAFLEHLDGSPNTLDSFFKIYVHFRGQRYFSKCVPVSCDPDFSEGFIFQMKSPGSCCNSVLSICDPIHIVLIRIDSDDETTLVSSHSYEWRHALADDYSASIKMIELMGIGNECKIHTGILEVKLQIVSPQQPLLAKKVVDAQLDLEKQRCCERERLFLNYAKQWWKEYVQVKDENINRPVKIFAQDETGVNRVVCGFIQRLRGSRLINSPRQAARFVSMFACERASFIGAGPKIDQWQSMHTFLCSKKGDHEDHSNLLCSFLLGFGLDAYVCIGLKSNNCIYSWVVVRHCDDSSVFFWDAVSGRRYAHHKVEPNDPPAIKQPFNTHPFKTIGCVYNHNSFYANNQPLDDVETTSFVFENKMLWKHMDEASIVSVTGAVHPNICIPFPPLLAPTLDRVAIEKSMEKDLQCLICQHRKDINLSTSWDNCLGYLLSQSLVAYETEKTYGLANVGNDDFKDAIKRVVPDGETFKGFPIQVLHCNAKKALKSCLKSDVCNGIVMCRGDNVRHALCCYVTVYPDNLTSTWIMIACRYRSIL